MDKSTLSNYGWIVIAVLVLSVMIALATPFGKYIETAVKSTTEGLFTTSQNAFNNMGLDAVLPDQEFDGTYEKPNGEPTYELLEGSATFNSICSNPSLFAISTRHDIILPPIPNPQ